ncbi:MAG: bifunctional UDP-4-keto-pentose/UDP-xylose synthase [Chitinivibrionales bacterium]|nr:bifunctional UDP-4-keto-pentose/UDP-xylose synthase [Chitinivibrionales bacterium]MBD3356578.1 bifunctional UDP-4-keto-pentose/UDP-xylose synthase [Chitinivibrionales bacterium]
MHKQIRPEHMNAPDNPTICILGCGGFIGSHLLGRLLSDSSCRVCGIDLTSAKIAGYLSHDRFEFVELNVHDTVAVREYVSRADIVISLVALCNPSLYTTIPLDVIDINFTRPLELVRMCAEMGKWLIHFSTSEVYGRTVSSFMPEESRGTVDESRYVLNEDTSPLVMGPIKAQRWCYASAKQLLERVMFAYAFEKDLEYTIVRPFNFIGPRMDFIPGVDGEGTPRVLACFMEALLKHKPIQLVDGGKNRRCFTYVDDAVDAVMAILNHAEAAKGRIFNVGNPENETTIAGLAETMIALYRELCPECEEVEVEQVSGRAFYGPGYEDSDRRVPDITKARERLGWEPCTALEPALRATMSHYIREYREACAYGKAG